MPDRAAAFARLFDAAHEGVYIGSIVLVGADGSEPDGAAETVASNPHLKRILGLPADAAEADVRPFDLAALRRPAGATQLLREAPRRRVRARLSAAHQAARRRADLDRSHRQRLDLSSGHQHRGADSRRERPPQARRSVARPLPPAAAVREDGGPRPDDLRRRARAEQSARPRSCPGPNASPSSPPTTRRAADSKSSSVKPNAPRASSGIC